MFSKYTKIIAMLMALCMLTACAGPAKEPVAAAPAETVTVESCTSEVPEEPADDPWADYAVSSPEMAEEIARAEIKKLQELGLLAQELFISDEAPDFLEFMDDSWEDGPYWTVRWYGGRSYLNDWQGGDKYSVIVNINPDSGLIDYFSIEANGDEDDEFKEVKTMALVYDEATGEDKHVEESWYYCENYGDIFAEDMSVDGFCSLLMEYWGYDSYKLCPTEDYGYNIEVPNGSYLVKDMKQLDANYYLTVEFEQDGEVRPCYIQAGQFPARVFLNVGNSHTKG